MTGKTGRVWCRGVRKNPARSTLAWRTMFHRLIPTTGWGAYPLSAPKRPAEISSTAELRTQPARAVRGDPIDARPLQPTGLVGIVDSPDIYFEPLAVNLLHESRVERPLALEIEGIDAELARGPQNLVQRHPSDARSIIDDPRRFAPRQGVLGHLRGEA